MNVNLLFFALLEDWWAINFAKVPHDKLGLL